MDPQGAKRKDDSENSDVFNRPKRAIGKLSGPTHVISNGYDLFWVSMAFPWSLDPPDPPNTLPGNPLASKQTKEYYFPLGHLGGILGHFEPPWTHEGWSQQGLVFATAPLTILEPSWGCLEAVLGCLRWRRDNGVGLCLPQPALCFHPSSTGEGGTVGGREGRREGGRARGKGERWGGAVLCGVSAGRGVGAGPAVGKPTRGACQN